MNRILRAKDSLILKPKRCVTSSPIKKSIFIKAIADGSSENIAETKDNRINDFQYGEIQLFIKFSESKLIVKVLKACNLINNYKLDSNDKFDYYVRLLLLPDRKKRSKRKTKVIKDSLEPKWDEQFEYSVLTKQSLK